MAASKKRTRIAVIIILLFLIAIVPAYFIVENYLENKIKDQLTNELLPGHRVEVSEVELDLLWGNLLLDSINIRSLKDPEKLQKFIVRNAVIPSIEITGIKVIKLLLSDELHIGEINLQRPELSLEIPEPRADSVKASGKLPVDRISLGNVIIHQMNFSLVSGEKARTLMAFDSLNFNAGNFRLSFRDSVSFELPVVKKLNLLNFKSVVNDPFYALSIENIYLQDDSNLVVRTVKLSPEYEKYEFARKLGHQTDRADLLLDSLFIGGIDWEKFPDGIYRFRLLSLNGLHAELLRDKRIPRPEGYVPPLPQQALRNLDQKLLIDSLQVNSAEINYFERVPGSNRPGHVFFNRLNILVLNINNNPGFFGVKNLIDCYATGALMGESLARVRVWFPVINANDTMYFKGKLENFRLDNLNEIVTPNEHVKIDEGLLNRLEFEASANNTFSSGELMFLYQDLKVSVLRDQKSLLKEQALFSFLVNRVIRSNNPVRKRDPLIARMYFERDMEKSALNFLWKSIFSGVKATVTPSKQNLERGKEKDYFKR